MIVNSSGQIAPVTVHDHETPRPGAARAAAYGGIFHDREGFDAADGEFFPIMSGTEIFPMMSGT
jgi:hypothetical protein